MEKNIEICLLLDFYGQILTPRQEELLSMYFNNDLSLGEISENLGITRQGVHDNIKRGEKTLYDMENRLGLVKRFREEKNKIRQAIEYIDEIEEDFNKNKHDQARKRISHIKIILNEIIDS